MHITIIGSGYVGLTSGACFAEFGVNVTCVDIDKDKINLLNAGKLPIYEPGLEELIKKNVNRDYLSFTTNLETAVSKADVVFIAVGTPTHYEEGNADLSHVYEAALQISKYLQGYTVVAVKSTVPVGTGHKIQQIIANSNSTAEFDIVSNPEFLRQGSAIEDFMRPDRVVIGCQSERASLVMRELYRPLYLLETPMVFTNLQTAEISKYAANAFLATKIAFINEIAELCEKCDADVQDVAKSMGLDKRIGSKFLHAGPGYGGSCFPKDTLALVHTAQGYNAPQRIIQAVIDSNKLRKQSMAQRIIAACDDSVENKKIAILGLTFKPNTGDMRDSPSLDIITQLHNARARIYAFDPQGIKEATKLLPYVHYCHSPYAAMNGAEALVIVTEWNEFRALDLAQVKQKLKNPIIIDLRNIYNPKEMAAMGFSYISIGRSPSCTALKSARA